MCPNVQRFYYSCQSGIALWQDLNSAHRKQNVALTGPTESTAFPGGFFFTIRVLLLFFRIPSRVHISQTKSVSQSEKLCHTSSDRVRRRIRDSKPLIWKYDTIPRWVRHLGGRIDGELEWRGPTLNQATFTCSTDFNMSVSDIQEGSRNRLWL